LLRKKDCCKGKDKRSGGKATVAIKPAMKLSSALREKMRLLQTSAVRFDAGRQCFVDAPSGKKKRGLTKMLARMMPVPQQSSGAGEAAVITGKRVGRFTGKVMAQCGTCKGAMAVTRELLVERAHSADRNSDRVHGKVVDYQLAIYAGQGRAALFRECAVVDPCVGALIEQLDAENLVAFASQTPVHCARLGCATAIDLLVTDRATRSRVLLLEIKATRAMTAQSVREYEATHGIMTRGAMKGLSLSYYARHQTQLLCMQQMLQRQFGIAVDEARLVRLAPGVVHTYPLATHIEARADALFTAIERNMRQRALRRKRRGAK
jgi:hypothetical protein